jgi:hypothetical protein
MLSDLDDRLPSRDGATFQPLLRVKQGFLVEEDWPSYQSPQAQKELERYVGLVERNGFILLSLTG